MSIPNQISSRASAIAEDNESAECSKEIRASQLSMKSNPYQKSVFKKPKLKPHYVRIVKELFSESFLIAVRTKIEPIRLLRHHRSDKRTGNKQRMQDIS